jgi:hypothetical protein
MKCSIVLFFVGLNLVSNAQTNSEIHDRLSLLMDSQVFDFDTTGVSSFSVIPNPCDDSINWDYYHVIDLNFDGLKDLVFSGPCNPYIETVVFLNNGNELEKVFQCGGQLITIENMASSSAIYIIKEAVGCDKYLEQLELIIDKDSNLIQNTISFHTETTVTILDNLSTFEFKGFVRTNPKCDNKRRKDECSGIVYKGNRLFSIKKRTEVLQLNKSGDWILILYKENHERYWIGWVESKKFSN